MISTVPVLTTPIMFYSVHLIMSHINSNDSKLSGQNCSPVSQLSTLEFSPATSLAIPVKTLPNSSQYLSFHMHYHQPVRSFCSSDQHFLVPALTLALVLSVLPLLSFGIQYPSKYAHLPTIDTFKRNLKTHYFCSHWLGNLIPVQLIHS